MAKKEKILLKEKELWQDFSTSDEEKFWKHHRKLLSKAKKNNHAVYPLAQNTSFPNLFLNQMPTTKLMLSWIVFFFFLFLGWLVSFTFSKCFKRSRHSLVLTRQPLQAQIYHTPSVSDKYRKEVLSEDKNTHYVLASLPDAKELSAKKGNKSLLTGGKNVRYWSVIGNGEKNINSATGMNKRAYANFI